MLALMECFDSLDRIGGHYDERIIIKKTCLSHSACPLRSDCVASLSSSLYSTTLSVLTYDTIHSHHSGWHISIDDQPLNLDLDLDNWIRYLVFIGQ
jgi:hypothetical protein